MPTCRRGPRPGGLACSVFIAPFLVLGGAHYLSVFTAEQLQALALLFLRLNHVAERIALAVAVLGS